MQIIVESRDPHAAAMRNVGVERIRFTLRRLSAYVPRAKVLFSDTNGPRGGVDKRCVVELKTARCGTLFVSSSAHDWRSALDTSLARVARVLTRNLKRHQSPARGQTLRTHT